MSLKQVINGKKGSYIVEAALTLPILIISIIAISLIIEIYIAFEAGNYRLSLEAKEISTISGSAEELGLVKSIGLKSAILGEDERIQTITISNFDYLYRANDIDDLIAYSVAYKFKIKNPLGIDEKLNLKVKLLTRSFSGKDNSGSKLSISDFKKNQKSQIVYIFPRYGYSYHIASCTYVKRTYKNEYKVEIELEEAKMEGYVPCKVCKGGTS